MGPKRQCKNMTKARRRWAAGIYLIMMILTIVVALSCKGKGCGLLIVVMVFCQWCAAIWYIASYIPFGQRIITRMLGTAAGSVGGM